MILRRNVGGLDRALRLGLGLVLLPLGSWMVARDCPCGWVDLVLGLLGLATGISGFCVMYVPFGISTARHRLTEQR